MTTGFHRFFHRATASLVAVATASIPISCAPQASTNPQHASATGLAMDSENELSEFDLGSGQIVRRARLSSRPTDPSTTIPGHYLAATADRQTVFVLVRVGVAMSQVVAVDRRTLTRKWSSALVPSAGAPRAVVVAPISRAVFALTDFEVSPRASRPFPVARPVVSKLDATTGTILASATLREPDPKGQVEDWQILQGAVDAQEQTLFVSYHNQGLFTYSLTDQGFRSSCQGSSCLPAHGDIAPLDGGMVVATGSGLLDVLRSDGSIKRSLDTGLERNHLMAFGLDTVGRRVVVVGSCLYVPAMVTVNLDSGARRVIAPESAASKPCGERVLLYRGKVLVAPKVAAFAEDSGAVLYSGRLTALDLLT